MFETFYLFPNVDSSLLLSSVVEADLSLPKTLC